MYIETAIEAAKLGGKILQENQNSKNSRTITSKQQFDFVTQVDYLSEQALISFIQEQHPGHSILAEETGKQQTDSDYQWILDPLDGTKNYIHGIPFFSVSVALKYKNELIAGAVFDPTRDELFYAEKNGGAFLNGTKIEIGKKTELSDALLATGFPFKIREHVDTYFKTLRSMFNEIRDVRRCGSAALDLSYVACGRLDGFWEIGLSIWDMAAGILFVKEAGGVVYDIMTQSTTKIASGSIIATNIALNNTLQPYLNNVFSKKQLEPTRLPSIISI